MKLGVLITKLRETEDILGHEADIEVCVMNYGYAYGGAA